MTSQHHPKMIPVCGEMHAGFATDGLAFFCLNCNRSFGSLTGLTKHLDVLGFNNPDIWLTIRPLL